MRASCRGAQLAAWCQLAGAHLSVLAVDAPEAQGLTGRRAAAHVVVSGCTPCPIRVADGLDPDCRWRKNVSEGSDGSRVDELLQLSTLQRLARQRITEMEVGPYATCKHSTAH